MNNRDYKKFAPNNYYHVYNRGNGKMNIFRDTKDLNFFLFRLKEDVAPEKIPPLQREIPSPRGYYRRPLPPNSFSVISYCLMPNHFHILIKQLTDVPVSKLIGKICTSYSKYFNKKYNRVGSLFQDQFRSVLVDDNSYLVWLSAYIHQNPKVAGIVAKPEEYKWSSCSEFIKGDSGFCGKEIITKQFKTINDYEKFVRGSSQIIKDKKDLESSLLDAN